MHAAAVTGAGRRLADLQHRIVAVAAHRDGGDRHRLQNEAVVGAVESATFFNDVDAITARPEVAVVAVTTTQNLVGRGGLHRIRPWRPRRWGHRWCHLRDDIGNRPHRAVVELEAFDLVVGISVQRIDDAQLVAAGRHAQQQGVGRLDGALHAHLARQEADQAHDVGTEDTVVPDLVVAITTRKDVDVAVAATGQGVVASTTTQGVGAVESGDDIVARGRLLRHHRGLDIGDGPGGAVVKFKALDLIVGVAVEGVDDAQLVTAGGHPQEQGRRRFHRDAQRHLGRQDADQAQHVGTEETFVPDQVVAVTTLEAVDVAVAAARQLVVPEATDQRIGDIRSGDVVITHRRLLRHEPRLDVGNRPRGAIVESKSFDLVEGIVVEGVDDAQQVGIAIETQLQRQRVVECSHQLDFARQITPQADGVVAAETVVFDGVVAVVAAVDVKVAAVAAKEPVVAEAAGQRIGAVEADDDIVEQRVRLGDEHPFHIGDGPDRAVVELEALDLVAAIAVQRIDDAQCVGTAGKADQQGVPGIEWDSQLHVGRRVADQAHAVGVTEPVIFDAVAAVTAGEYVRVATVGAAELVVAAAADHDVGARAAVDDVVGAGAP